ncbi:MAG: radical SAM protein [Clostridiales bacterium]|nr:radical SAM protein [Clostridiales bacterium]
MNSIVSSPERHPVSATFELTARCNFSCKMCFVRVDEQRISQLGQRELTAAEWISLARQAADMGTLNLLLTGGEPMLREDFEEIYEAISRMGFYLSLYTNASMITPRIRRLLTKYPPHQIGVTLYGASEQTYNRLCGVSGAFERVIQGIRFLHTLPSRLELRTTYVKDNVADMRAIRQLVAGIDERLPIINNFTISNAVRGGVADPISHRLSPRENVDMVFNNIKLALEELLLKEMRNPRTMPAEKRKLMVNENPPADGYLSIYGCGGGMSFYTITWNGRLIACQTMDEEGVDVLKESLSTAWDVYPLQVVHPEPAKACQTCLWQTECASCPALRKAETGSINGITPHHCKIAELFYNRKLTDQRRQGETHEKSL